MNKNVNNNKCYYDSKRGKFLGKDGGIVRLVGGFFWLGGQENTLLGGNILAEPRWQEATSPIWGKSALGSKDSHHRGRRQK